MSKQIKRGNSDKYTNNYDGIQWKDYRKNLTEKEERDMKADYFECQGEKFPNEESYIIDLKAARSYRGCVWKPNII